jgi:hypothetical protein
MNTQNLDFLKDSLKYSGFDTRLNAALESNMEKELPEFQLKTDMPVGKDNMSYDLYFRQSDQGMYFFNKYDAVLKSEGTNDKKQTFYQNQNITAKEAYNLLSGRAVNKNLTNNEGQKYNAWLQLDFNEKDQHGNYKVKQFHENYGYNLEMKLKEIPAKELTDNEKTNQLIRSLKKGNRPSVTIEKNGEEQKVMLEANPQYKTINLYNSNGTRLGKNNLFLEKENAQSNETKISQNQSSSQKQQPDSKKQPQQKNQKKTAKKRGMHM